MADPAKRLRMTYAEYLVAERASETKHELVDGEMWAMSGGTITHGQLIKSVTEKLLGMTRGGPCRPYPSDVRVYVEALGGELAVDELYAG